ncbi:MAG: F0F1 ATP synthase subunit B [Clostridia bacterium]|nr:F0F1 ATP synthase subunit B [Clostridia bacterium]
MQLLTGMALTAVSEPQFLDIISVNLWNILIALLNLALLFWLIKIFLFKPIRKVLSDRQTAIEHQYAAAEEAQRVADENRDAWAAKLATADAEAEARINDATDVAKRRAQQIVKDADERADGIVRRAEEQAALERKRATEGMKREIVEVSTALTEKMLEREVNESDHRALIGDFIDKIGDGDGSDGHQ